MQRSRSIHAPILRVVAVLVLLTLPSLLWSGGCTTEKRYEVLSFFFDGVPDPNAPGAAAGGSAGTLRLRGQPMVVFGHKPYVEGKCDSCHSGRVDAVYTPAVSAISAQVCLKCHAAVLDQYPVMHGPVAVAECLWCHAPHEANFPALLRQRSPDVCVQCHARELLSADPPQHQSPDASCLDCHVAHGGNEHGLLKPGVAWSPPPATNRAPDETGGVR